jgi:hypothetical protein
MPRTTFVFLRPETLHRLPAKSKGTCFVRSTRGDEALLAVGSDSWHQYQQGIELDMLRTVLEVVSSLTEPSAAETGKNPVSSTIRG